jgi:site-specific recombinase XerD
LATGLRARLDESRRSVRREYAGYLARERGLGTSSIRAYTVFARRFVVEERPRLDWDRLTAAEITSFILHCSRRSSLAGRKLTVTYLRSLLRFLHVRGATAQDLASCVPAVAGWRLATLPKALEVSQIDRLLASFDGSPVGLRDSAIVRLLLRLGLRAAEVAALDLDDVDWRSGELAVQGKDRHESRLPLPPDVGRALAAYLRRGRPRASTRSLFLRSRAPYARICPSAVSRLVQTALRRAGVATGGAHLLRHTVATQLLRRGASLPEIAHVLRHRHIDTTAIHAKVDLDSLGALVRPWQSRSHEPRRPAASRGGLPSRFAAPSVSSCTTRRGSCRISWRSSQPKGSVITTELALRWAQQPPHAAPYWWAKRLSAVRCFAKHHRAFDPRTEVPPPDLILYRAQRQRPHIYTDEEVASLMHAARGLPGALRSDSYATLIGLLAATGMRVGEAIALNDEDLDWRRSLLTVRHAKFQKSRLRPSTSRRSLLFAPTTLDETTCVRAAVARASSSQASAPAYISKTSSACSGGW